jgi:hypothetical protein
MGEVFLVKIFTRNKAKLNQGVSKYGQDHKLGDTQGTPLYQHKYISICKSSNFVF